MRLLSKILRSICSPCSLKADTSLQNTLIWKTVFSQPDFQTGLAANGETTSSPPLFIGGEPCNYPIMFSGSTSGPLPPPPSYLHSLFPPYLPPPLPNASEVPPYEINQRPPPLGGRLSSPPPMPPLHPPASNRYDNAGSLPRISPPLLPPPPSLEFRSCLLSYSSEMYPPPPGLILPPSLEEPHTWEEESLPPLRNSGFHPAQRERVRNHKGLCIR